MHHKYESFEIIMIMLLIIAIFIISALKTWQKKKSVELSLLVQHVKEDFKKISNYLEEFYTSNTYYPPSLQKVLPQVPRDPFRKDGGTYTYYLLPNGWIVYSYGPDHQDDNGKVEWDPQSGSRGKGDIVIRRVKRN